VLFVPAEAWIASERRYLLLKGTKYNLPSKILQAQKPPPDRAQKALQGGK